jgi:hypothetical protein
MSAHASQSPWPLFAAEVVIPRPLHELPAPIAMVLFPWASHEAASAAVLAAVAEAVVAVVLLEQEALVEAA